jgi:hypothetical protein
MQRLAGAAAIRASKVTEAHNDDSNPDANQLSYAKNCAEFGALAKSVLTNPTYLALTLFASCDNFIIAGFTAFGPKYFEFGFSMSPTLAGIMFGKPICWKFESDTFIQKKKLLYSKILEDLVIILNRVHEPKFY